MPPLEDRLAIRQLPRRHLLQHTKYVQVRILPVMIAGRRAAVKDHREEAIPMRLAQPFYEFGDGIAQVAAPSGLGRRRPSLRPQLSLQQSLKAGLDRESRIPAEPNDRLERRPEAIVLDGIQLPRRAGLLPRLPCRPEKRRFHAAVS